MTGRTGITRGWRVFLLSCAGIAAAVLVYCSTRPDPIIPVTEHKFYAIVRTVDGLPIPGATVEVRASGPALSETVIRATTNEAGRVEVYYPPGETIIVRIERDGFAPRTETYIRPAGVRPDDKPLRVTLDGRPR